MMNKEQALNLLKNTFIDYELVGGMKVKLTLSFYLLKRLETKNPDLIKRYYEAQTKDAKQRRDSDIITLVYVAYCCANMDDPDLMDEEVFSILMGYDRASLNSIVARLVGAKKN